MEKIISYSMIFFYLSFSGKKEVIVYFHSFSKASPTLLFLTSNIKQIKLLVDNMG